ncbi:MAG: CRISPR-associated endonuclease Cas3'', partial [Actinobacteria bacterium ATB1]|nr:CRISPR-associated endonuclease Cas3'' [Actinobacteria bacterium ATB1]
MPELHPSDFGNFVRDVHGYDPYPWQERLLRDVLDRKCWPDLVDLPTGSGKTSLIDIAVYALAVSAQDSLTTWTPRRIILVVDRRVVVSQAARHAEKIADAIRARKSRTLDNVAAALGRLGDGDNNPLLTAELRGGMITDDAWTRRPDQAAVLTSTVDQIGSRLLFRGYGVSKGMRSVHAGLLGADCLYLLDEVHLSQPFKQTLHAIRRLQAEPELGNFPPAIHAVEVSATPVNSDRTTDGREPWVFRLERPDLEDPRSARLVQVLEAAKPTTLR